MLYQTIYAVQLLVAYHVTILRKSLSNKVYDTFDGSYLS